VATLIGYVINFEISIENNKFQQLPSCLQNVPLRVGLNAVGHIDLSIREEV